MLGERDLALTPGRRAVIIGSSGCGKSTLANRLIELWQADYCTPARDPKTRGRCLVCDDKPRFRATDSVVGHSVRRRYRDFVPGDLVRGVVLDDPAHWDLVWDLHLNPWQTVVAQAPDAEEDWTIFVCVSSIDRLFRTQKPKRPSLLYVDEGLSFFGPTGQGRHGTAIKRCFRAGREKNLTSLLASQRPREINTQTLTESDDAFIFRLNSDDDARHLHRMGFPLPPAELTGEADNWKFWWYRGGRLMHRRPLMLPAEVAA